MPKGQTTEEAVGIILEKMKDGSYAKWRQKAMLPEIREFVDRPITMECDWHVVEADRQELSGLTIYSAEGEEQMTRDQDELATMNTLTFAVTEVLDILKKNREDHIGIVREAQAGYREKAIEVFSKKLEELKAGGPVDLSIDLQVPSNHIDDYDRVIAMLDMAKDKQITLDENQFQCYIRNQWRWRHQFLASNSAYSGSAMMAFTSEDGV